MKTLVLVLLLLGLLQVTLATRTVDGAIQYGRTHPTRDGGSWAGWCAALMMRAGDFPSWAARDTAYHAYQASHIVSLDWNTAPAGAFHWWTIPGITEGHVAMATEKGWAMMASSKVMQSWGSAIGVTPLADYTAKTGGHYLGWSYDYAGAELTDVRKGGPRPSPSPSGSSLPQTTTALDGQPGTNYWRRMQLFASKYGYTGPIDGEMGVNSWKGVQRGLVTIGSYNGPIDGVPGKNLYMAMQRVAAKYGYTGPVDGVMGPNSYRGFAKFLNTL